MHWHRGRRSVAGAHRWQDAIPRRSPQPFLPVVVVVLALSAALFTAPATAAVSRSQADAKALAALGSKKGTAPVIVFREAKPLAPRTTIRQGGLLLWAAAAKSSDVQRDADLRAAKAKLTTAPLILRVGREPVWFYYEDKAPYQAYQHPGRVALVGTRSGKVTLSSTIQWPPFVGRSLPSFLLSEQGYRNPALRVFKRNWRLVQLPDTLRADRDENGASRQRAANALAAERSCAVRISDALGNFYDRGPVDRTRAMFGQIFDGLARLNPGFVTERYTIKAKTTPMGFVQRVIARNGCRDVFIYLAGGGYFKGEPTVNVGIRGRNDGRIEEIAVTASDLRALIRKNSGVTFKLKLDAPNSGAFLPRVSDLPNLRIFESSSHAGQRSWVALTELDGPDGQAIPNGANPRGLIEFTNRQLYGMNRFLDSAAEVDNAASKARSFMAWMLARSFDLGGVIDLARLVRGAPEPLIQTFGFTATPPTGTPANRPPTSGNKAVSTPEDTALAIALDGSDADGDALAFTIDSGPSHGTLTGTGASRTYTPTANYFGPDSFSYTVSDGRGGSATGSVSITVNPVNDVPVLTTTAGMVAYTENGALTPVDGGLTVADADDAQLNGATVRVSGGFQAGDELAFSDQLGITGSYDAPTGVLTLTGASDVSNYQAALRTVRFRESGDDPPTSKTVEFKVNDGDADSMTATKTIAITLVNDAPAVATTPSTLNYDEDSGPQPVDPALAVADPDSTQLQGGTVRISANFLSTEDELAFTNQSGITGTYDSGTGILTLTGTATVANYQTALRSVTYQNSSFDPSNATRTVSFQVKDTGAPTPPALDSATATRNVNVIKGNTRPLLTTTAGATPYTEGAAATVIDGGIAASDPDDTDLEAAQVRISANFQPGDVLEFTDTANITGAYNSGTGVLDLTGTDTVAGYEAALRTVRYRSGTNDNPSATKTVGFTANDGDVNSVEKTKSLTITPVNDKPTISSGGTLLYNENAGPFPVDGTLLLTDPENDPINRATVEITTGFQAAEDSLAWIDNNPGDGITLDVANSSASKITLTGTGTTAEHEAALRAVTYANGSDDPSTTTRQLSIQARDAGSPNESSTIVFRDITVIPFNDAPVVDTSAGSLTYIEGDPATVIDSTITVSDVDDTNIESARVRISVGFDLGDVLELGTNPQNGITGTYDSGTGILTLTGPASKANYEAALEDVRFRTTSDDSTSPKTVAYRVNDGDVDSAEDTHGITVTPVNDPPTMTTTTAFPLTYNENAGPLAVDGGVLLTDPEDDQITTATVEVTSNFQAGQDSLAWVDNDGGDTIVQDVGNSSASKIVLIGSGSTAQYTLALRAVTYANSSDDPSALTRTVTFQATDAGTSPQASNPATRDIDVVPANDAPTVTTSSGDTPYTEGDGDTTVDGGVTTDDVDDTHLESATVTISANLQTGDVLSMDPNPQNGITATYTPGTGVLALSGHATKADYDTALQSVAFRTTNTNPSTSKTIEFEVNDGDLDSAPATKTIAITPSNSPPVITTTAAPLGYTENDAATAVDDLLTLTEPEGENISGAFASITTNFQSLQDFLTWTDNNLADNITAAPFPATNDQTVTLIGADTAANYEAALRAVKYENTSEDPSGLTRTVTFSADDTNAVPATGTATRQIAVTPVDDPPTADPDAFQLDEDAPATSEPVLANDDDVDGGPMSIFSVTQPANGTVVITGGGTGLTYQPNLNYCNSPDATPSATPDTFTYRLNDAAGSTATVSMTVTCVNDAPVPDNETFNGTNSAVRNTTFVGNDPADGAPATPDPTDTSPVTDRPHKTITGDILDGDTDVDGPGPLIVTGAGTNGSNGATTQGGTVTVEQDGDFVYEPPAGCTASSDTFLYTVSDQNTPTAGTATGTVTIALTGCVWYVNNDDAQGDSGTSEKPFDTLAQAQTASGDNDTIFVYDGDDTTSGYAAGIDLKSGQRLIGEAATLTVGSDTLHTADTANRPTLTDTVSDVVALDDGNTVAGVAVDPQGTGGGIAGTSGDTGGGTISDVQIVDGGTKSTAPGLLLDQTTGTFNISNLVVNNGDGLSATTGDVGVRLNQSGTVVFAPTSLISLTTDGAAALDVDGTVPTPVNLGTSTFDDITVTNSGAGGTSLTNTSGTVNFGDGGTDLSLTTTTGSAPAFHLNNVANATVGSTGTDNLSATGGPAVDVSSASGAVLDFDDVDSTNSAGAGITLSGLDAGTFSAATGSDIKGATTTSFAVSGGSGAITFPGGIGDPGVGTNDGNAQAVSVSNRTSGTVAISGSIDDDNDAGGGILVSNNTGGSTTLNGTSIKIDTTAGASGNPINNAVVMNASDGHTLTLAAGSLDIDSSGRGVQADTSGTLNITGSSNTISSVSGIALDVRDTDVGASPLAFQRIDAGNSTAAADPANGIVLSNTGANAALTVAGSGGTCTVANTSGCTGGEIQNTTGADSTSTTPIGTGVVLNNTRGVSLTRVRIHDHSNYGIRGTSVVGLTLADSVIDGVNGTSSLTANKDSSARFDNLSGTVSVTNSDISGGFTDNWLVNNTAGTLNATLTNVDFGVVNNASPEDSVQFEGITSATNNVTVTGSTFTSAPADLFLYIADGTGGGTLTFTGNALSNNHPAIVTGGGGMTAAGGANGPVTMNISNNTMRDSHTAGLTVKKETGTGSLNATIASNQIGVMADANSGSLEGDGMNLRTGSGNSTWNVTGNTIRQYNSHGMAMYVGTGTAGLSGTVNVNISGNTIGTPGNNPAVTLFQGIRVESGISTTDTFQTCVNFGANSITGSSDAPNKDWRLVGFGQTTVRLPTYPGGSQDDAAVRTFVNGKIGGGADGVASSDGSSSWTGTGTTCP